MREVKLEDSLQEKNPELAKEWNWDRNGSLTPLEVTSNSSKKVWWRCSRKHEWLATISNRSRGSGCPVCANKKAFVGYNDLATTNPDIAIEWDFDKNGNLKPEDVRPGTHKRVWWKCSRCGHQWLTSPHGRTSGKTGCPKCSKELQTSFPEQAIYYYLKKYFPDTINSDTSTIGMELDIYIPSEKIAVEYDGAKWHKGNAKNEKRKNNLCKEKGILLVRIREAGLEEYDDCAICFTRKNRQSVSDLTETIKKLLLSISSGLVFDVDVERDSKYIYVQYISIEKSRSLQELYPMVASEWHPELNGSLTPNKVRAKSRQKVWWRCTLGHEWKSTIGDRVVGTGCPYCSGRRILQGFNDLTTTSPELTKEWNYEKNFPLIPSEVNKGSNKNVWWKCLKGHEWQAHIYSRCKGDGCPYCSGHRLLQGYNDLTTVNPVLAREWNYDKNYPLTPQMVGKSYRKKVWWRCSKGHEWQALVQDRAGKGYGCPICSGHKVLAGYNDLATVRPDLATEWNYDKNTFSPQEVTRCSSKKVWWKCSKGHEWMAAVSERTNGNGCPICSNKQILIGFNDLKTTNPNLADEWHPTKNRNLTPEQVTASSYRRVYWLCKCGHEWQAIISNRSGNGNGCPICARKLSGIKRSTPKKGKNDFATVYPEIALEWHPTKNGEVTPDSLRAGSSRKVWWLGKCGHEWQSSIASRTRSNGCPVCAQLTKAKKLATPKKGINDLSTMNKTLAVEWHPTKNEELLPNQVSVFSGRKVWWLGKCGHEWQATIRNRSKGAGCPVCSGRQVLAGYNDLASINPSLAAEWHPTKNGDITPEQVSAGSNKIIWWQCFRGHEWQAKVNDRNNGNGCPICSNQRILAGYNDLATTNPPLAAEWHHDKNGTLTAKQVAAFSQKKVWWLGKCGHEWQATVASRSCGSSCPECFKKRKRNNKTLVNY